MALHIDWSKVDWVNKPDRQIADELGCSVQVVYAHRSLQYKYKGLQDATIAALPGIDWDKRNATIAAETGLYWPTVAILRNRFGHPSTEPRIRRPKYDWSSVDWTEQDSVIARRLGCVRERARQMRIELGKPKAVNHWHHNIPSKAKLAQEKRVVRGMKNLAKLRGRFPVEISAFPIRAIQRYCGLLAGDSIDADPHGGVGKLINFNLPDYHLAEIWRTTRGSMAICRIRLGKQKSKWVMPGAPITNINGRPFAGGAEFDQTIAAEKALAKRYFKLKGILGN